MKKILALMFAVIIAYAKNEGGDYVPYEADCLVIKEENSIICKYIAERSSEDRFINVEWIDPDGIVSRTRKILFPSGHGSVYDFRYLSGRAEGVWKFIVVDGDKTIQTEFEIKSE